MRIQVALQATCPRDIVAVAASGQSTGTEETINFTVPQAVCASGTLDDKFAESASLSMLHVCLGGFLANPRSPQRSELKEGGPPARQRKYLGVIPPKAKDMSSLQ